ncbi:MAG: ergothioneine biosynthesis protein EgtB [Halioglobus sp.]|nr:ergothioneine biosynthesis protein EgtB [Halioglobus sp.]
MTEALLQRFRDTRAQSLAFCAPLAIEDYGLQAEPFTSPPKWHLAHTTWFFETFLLQEYLEGYTTPEPRYTVLFNSYYNGIGEQHPRPQRGLLSRPTVDEVRHYRAHVDAGIEQLLADTGHAHRTDILTRVHLGIEHECQHQELFFTDLKWSLGVNPMLPTYAEPTTNESPVPMPQSWHIFNGGLVETGFDGDGFCFDNELPRHQTFVEPFALAGRLVTNAEFAIFIDDGGYQRPELWLADGWDAVQTQGWTAPHYWRERDGQALEYTLHGLQPRADANPVCHVSGYEADAYARWANARLPTEHEWELAAATAVSPAGGVDTGCYHPQPAEGEGLQQLYGDCWQWTQSAYGPYPGFRPSAGAIGEYNGKFMSSQWVLRGGSCVSKAEHLRPTYRNFFYPPDRWQFSGIRLAKDGQQ